jgi:anti-sigma regulatory factor (Ser/Thr protein kinase)
MQVVGSTAVGVVRLPGIAVAVRPGDVAAAVLARIWRLVRCAVAAGRHRIPTGLMPALAARARWVPQMLTTRVLGRAGVVAHPAVGLTLVGPGTLAPHELVLPADATAPRRARELLASAVQEWDVDDDLYQDAAMVVTELVANAVDHARTASTLRLGIDDKGLCIAVRDARPGPVPRPRPVDPAAPRGRGLQMIAALACSWGVTTHIDGKTVWAVLRRS